MNIKKIVKRSIFGVLSDQQLDIVIPGKFADKDAIVPGISKNSKRDFSKNDSAVLANGSIISVPDNCAAIIYGSSGIIEFMDIPGTYQFESGQKSILFDAGLKDLANQMKKRFSYGGYADNEVRVSYINLQEIRDLGFGTDAPIFFHDSLYRADFQIVARGHFSIIVKDPIRFMFSYVPVNVERFSFKDRQSKRTLTAEINKHISNEIMKLSGSITVTELSSYSLAIGKEVYRKVLENEEWLKRYGLELVGLQVDIIEPTEEATQQLNRLSVKRSDATVFSGIPDGINEYRKAQQNEIELKKLELVFKNGIHGGALLVNNGGEAEREALSALLGDHRGIDKKMEDLEKAKQLLDSNVISSEEFDVLKKKILDQ